MGDEEIRASLEGQDGSAFSMISYCVNSQMDYTLSTLKNIGFSHRNT